MGLSLEQAALLAEILGGLAVVVTLIYLAIQIRQNTIMVKMSALQNIVQGGVDHNRAIADNPELAALINKAVDDPESLSDDEQLRVNANALTLYHHLDAAFQMYEAGVLDADAWAKFAYEVPIWLRIRFMREWFELDKQRLSPGFRAYIEKALEDSPVPDKLPAFGRPLPDNAPKNDT